MEALGKLVFVLIALAVSAIIQGFVFSKIWSWFIAPVLDAPDLSITQSIGIMLVLGFATAKRPTKESESVNEGALNGVIFTVILGIFTLLAAYIISLLA